MIYPNNPLYLLSLLGYIYYLTYYTLTTKDNIEIPPKKSAILNTSIADCLVKYNLKFISIYLTTSDPRAFLHVCPLLHNGTAVNMAKTANPCARAHHTV